ncbi:MAG: hypothetical protein IPL88_12690 [Rhizobiales bacterium]|nr:hypothetical protein [Hyphomicrobiales bacterium]
MIRPFAAFAALLLAAPALAADIYPFDLPKKHPAAAAAWRKIVPKAYARVGWVAKFQGVGTPMDAVSLDGKPFLAGNICKAHDCGGNFVAILVALDGSRAYGLLRSEALKAVDAPFGAPGPKEIAILKARL